MVNGAGSSPDEVERLAAGLGYEDPPVWHLGATLELLRRGDAEGARQALDRAREAAAGVGGDSLNVVEAAVLGLEIAVRLGDEAAAGAEVFTLCSLAPDGDGWAARARGLLEGSGGALGNAARLLAQVPAAHRSAVLEAPGGALLLPETADVEAALGDPGAGAAEGMDGEELRRYLEELPVPAESPLRRVPGAGVAPGGGGVPVVPAAPAPPAWDELRQAGEPDVEGPDLVFLDLGDGGPAPGGGEDLPLLPEAAGPPALDDKRFFVDPGSTRAEDLLAAWLQDHGAGTVREPEEVFDAVMTLLEVGEYERALATVEPLLLQKAWPRWLAAVEAAMEAMVALGRYAAGHQLGMAVVGDGAVQAGDRAGIVYYLARCAEGRGDGRMATMLYGRVLSEVPGYGDAAERLSGIQRRG